MVDERTHIFCPKCGAKNPVGAKFCQGCGGEMVLPNSNAINPQTSNQVTAEPVKYSKNLADEESHTLAIVLGYIFSLLGSVLGIIASVYLQRRDSPKAVLHGRVQAMIFGVWTFVFGFYYGWIFFLVGLGIIAAMSYYIILDETDLDFIKLCGLAIPIFISVGVVFFSLFTDYLQYYGFELKILGYLSFMMIGISLISYLNNNLDYKKYKILPILAILEVLMVALLYNVSFFVFLIPCIFNFIVFLFFAYENIRNPLIINGTNCSLFAIIGLLPVSLLTLYFMSFSSILLNILNLLIAALWAGIIIYVYKKGAISMDTLKIIAIGLLPMLLDLLCNGYLLDVSLLYLPTLSFFICWGYILVKFRDSNSINPID